MFSLIFYDLRDIPSQKRNNSKFSLAKTDSIAKRVPVKPTPIKMIPLDPSTKVISPITPKQLSYLIDEPKEKEHLMINIESSCRSRIEHLMISFDDFGPIC